MRELIRLNEVVLDFGCGVGRNTQCFAPEKYIGVDVNLSALLQCEARYPNHRFEYVQDVLPSADVALVYTVLLHVSDDSLDATVARLARAVRRVIVVEILGRKWRGKPGVDPQTFNRELQEYVDVFDDNGMDFGELRTWPYARYGGVSISAMEFRKWG